MRHKDNLILDAGTPGFERMAQKPRGVDARCMMPMPVAALNLNRFLI